VLQIGIHAQDDRRRSGAEAIQHRGCEPAPLPALTCEELHLEPLGCQRGHRSRRRCGAGRLVVGDNELGAHACLACSRKQTAREGLDVGSLVERWHHDRQLELLAHGM